MLITIPLMALLSVNGAGPTVWSDRHGASVGPQLEVWTNHDDPVSRGERMRVFFKVDRSSYVTIFRVDTDGRVRVLFPRDPWDDSYARGDRRHEAFGYGDRQAFMVDDYPGQGYIFGVASLDPFDYSDFVRSDHWDYRVIATGGRIAGDPYVALMDLIDHIVPRNYVDYNYDVVPYYVEQRYEYPRFLCYDCHSYAAFPYWDPYANSCVRFRIVIYDDPFYYPARYFPGTRVVYPRGVRPQPRYVFKDQDQAQPYVTKVRERPTDPTTGRRLADPGVTARDLGGTGRVPAPIARPRGGDRSGAAGDPRRPAAEPRRAPSEENQPRRIDAPAERRPGAGQAEPIRRPVAPTDTQADVERQRPQLERRDPKREVEPPAEPPRRAEPGGESVGGRPVEPDVRPQPERPVAPPPRVEPRREPSRAEPRREPPRAEPKPAPPTAQPQRQPAKAPPPPRRADPPEDGIAGRPIERPQ